MKRKLVIFAMALLCVCAIQSCSLFEKDSVLAVDLNVLSAGAEGETVSFSVTSNCDWIVSGAKPWIKVNPSSGSGNAVVDVDVEPNTTVDSRSCTLTVRTMDGSLSQSVEIKQANAEVGLSVNTNSVNLTYKAGVEVEFTITSNAEWSLRCNESWLHFSSDKGEGGQTTIKVSSLTDNFSDEKRTATATISAKDKSVSVSITQQPELAPDCRVSVDNVIVMLDGAAGDLVIGPAARGYIEMVFTKFAASGYGEKELYNIVMSEGDRWPYNDKTNYFFTPGNLSAGTEYVYCILAYDSESHCGPMLKYEFKTKESTPKYDAIVNVYKSGYWYFEIKKQDQCKRYYHWGYVDEDADELYSYFAGGVSHAAIAYVYFEPKVKKDPNNYAINDISKYYSGSQNNYSCITVSWGLNDDLIFSSELRYNYKSVSSKPLTAKVKNGAFKFTKDDVERIRKQAVIYYGSE